MESPSLIRVFIVPPLAIARVGASPQPCDAFLWGPNDISPRGSGMTTLVPTLSLDVAEDGSVTSRIPDEIVFRDKNGIRPVCPFFELHGEWRDQSGAVNQGPITKQLLQSWGLELEDITWGVTLTNLKAFHYTYQAGDRVEGSIEANAGEHDRKPVLAWSPGDPEQQLIRQSRPMPVGAVQAVAPSDALPEIRLRFYAPPGITYGPVDLVARIGELDIGLQVQNSRPNAEWKDFRLPDEHLIVNADATWPRYVPDIAGLGPFFGNDYRNTPGGLLAAPFSRIPWIQGNPISQRSLGLVDDVTDGIVTCVLRLGDTAYEAAARLVVGPPDFAPANRTPVTLADNLADRQDRAGPRLPNGLSRDDLDDVVRDILERAFETSDLMHRDYQNFRSHRTNAGALVEQGGQASFDEEEVRSMLWTVASRRLVEEGRVSALALSETGTWKHRRYAAMEYLEDRFRENPQLFDQWIRTPVHPSPFFDRKMPALMRGSDGRALHLTRRQWEILRIWVETLRAEAPNAGMAGPEVGHG